MAQLPAPESGSIAIAPSSVLELNGQVSFDVSYPGKLKNPLVQVIAFQGETVVDLKVGAPDQTYVLGGPSSVWLANGGPANCHADLFYYKTGNHEWNGSGQQEFVHLAGIDFQAGG